MEVKELINWVYNAKELQESTRIAPSGDGENYDPGFYLTREDAVVQTQPEKAEGFEFQIALSLVFNEWNEIAEIKSMIT